MCATSGSASFTVVAGGTAPFTYQGEYNDGGTWAAVVNGTPAGASYTNATTVNDAFPDVAHMLLSAGCVPIVTGSHVEVTVTVTVNVAPMQAPEAGVTV